jgi:hypothetical protein
MDPAWSGGGGALPALRPSCVSHVCRPPIKLLHYCKVLLDYCICIVIVVHSSLIDHHVITQISKLLYLILSLIFFCFIMKNSTQSAPPLARAGWGVHPPSKSIPVFLYKINIILFYKCLYIYIIFYKENCFYINIKIITLCLSEFCRTKCWPGIFGLFLKL